MTRKRNKPGQPSNASRAPSPDRKRTPVPSGRLWCFRLIALLSPLLMLGALELSLRLAGYGHPTGFFLTVNDNGRAMLRDNPWFGWRFFPPAVARAPRPLYLPSQKPANTVRIFIFGGSAAMGDPEPAYGFARQLEYLLRARHPGEKIEVVNAAMTAINTHVVRLIARDCAPHDGDFWIVYAGNNEVIGPFGAGTIFGHQAPSLATVRAVLALKTTRIGQLLAQLTRRADEPKEWEGLEFFLRWKVAHDDPRLKRVYASFAANLDDIVNYGRKSGASVMLSTVAVNLRNFPPLASVHHAGLLPEQLADWKKSFSAGTRAQAEANWTNALSEFRKAADIDDNFAELAFQRARCEVELKQGAAAEADFRRARDLDALRFRTDSRMNEIIRHTANAEKVPLVDAARDFQGAVDTNLFYDHVHLDFAGNYRMAMLFAEELEKHWPGARGNNEPWLTESQVRRGLAFTPFDERRVGEEMRARMQQPPFNAQSNFRSRDEHWAVSLTALSAPPTNYVPNYETAVGLSPDDWVLRADFARLLEATGNNSGAAEQWSEVSRLMPHSPEGWANLGRLARIAGDSKRAGNLLQRALKEQPDSVEARTEFGILESSLGDTRDARRQFDWALRLQPGFIAARVNLGLLLAHEGDNAGAAAEYRQALRWSTNNIEARIDLANLLFARGQNADAKKLYEQAVELEPENPVVRYNLGRLLAAENRDAEAVTNFEIAIKQRPDLAEIHFELGNVLARMGRESEALREFAEAVRLNPNLADAHLNYGVALARSGRYSEAVSEFRETLRLHPQDQRAQQMLSQAKRLAGGTGENRQNP